MLYLLSLPLFSGVTFYMPVNNVPHVVSYQPLFVKCTFLTSLPLIMLPVNISSLCVWGAEGMAAPLLWLSIYSLLCAYSAK